jgi:hypothetical protein
MPFQVSVMYNIDPAPAADGGLHELAHWMDTNVPSAAGANANIANFPHQLSLRASRSHSSEHESNLTYSGESGGLNDAAAGEFPWQVSLRHAGGGAEPSSTGGGDLNDWQSSYGSGGAAAAQKIGPFKGVLVLAPAGEASDDAPLDFGALVKAAADAGTAGQSSGLGDTITHEVGHWLAGSGSAFFAYGDGFTGGVVVAAGDLGGVPPLHSEFDLV